MAIRYKTTTMNGRPIPTHKKVWLQNYGPIPKGMCLHHINKNKFDNRLENLEVLSYTEHNRIHATDRPIWNRGIQYGETEAYKKSNESRKINHLVLCKEVLSEYEKGNCTQAQLAEKYNVSSRQICDRLKRARETAR